jgi:hypothetical protein
VGDECGSLTERLWLGLDERVNDVAHVGVARESEERPHRTAHHRPPILQVPGTMGAGLSLPQDADATAFVAPTGGRGILKMTMQLRTLACTDLETLVPTRLADLDYHCLERQPALVHRGHEVEVERLIGRLGAALDHAAVEAGEGSAPSTLGELDAVDVVLEALAERVPRWFGCEEALAAYDEPVSDEHLEVSELREAYWGGELAAETRPVEGDDWTAQKRVIVPVVALVWERVDVQEGADKGAAVAAGQEAITQAVLEAGARNGLTEAEILAAVSEGVAKLQTRRSRGRRKS